MKNKFSIPADAMKAIKKAKGKVYVVGGAVRDAILNIPSKDLDIIVSGIPYEKLCDILHKFGKIDLVGKSFGIIKWLPIGYEESIDVALPRTEVSTGNGHHDFQVKFDHTLDIKDDLSRRDFTINAIAYELNSNTIIDPYLGRKDLECRNLIPVSENSFKDDPLRMMRGIQFIGRFNLDVSGKATQMFRDNAYRIKYVSKERIAIEFEKLFNKGKHITKAFKEMNYLGLWKYIFPEFVYPDFLNFDNPEMDINLKLAMIFAHSTSRVNDREQLAKDTIREFKLSIAGVNENKVLRLVRNAESLNFKPSFYQLRSYISKEMNGDIENFYDQVGLWASSPAFKSEKCFTLCNMAAKIERSRDPLKIAHLAINGNDLLSLGITGKDIGENLQQCLNMVLEYPYKNDYSILIESVKS